MSLPGAARLYLYVVALSAGAALLAWLQWGLAHGISGASSPDLRLVSELSVLAIVAQQFQLPVTPKRKVALYDGPYFAGLVLFGAPTAVILAGFSELIGQGVLAWRRLRGRRAVLFNSAQIALAMALAGVAYHTLPSPWNVAAAGAVWYLVNTFAVATMTALQFRTNPFELWAISRRRNAMQVAALLFMGWLTARASAQDPWIPFLMVLPAAAVYLSMKRTAQLVEQTVGAVEAMADVVDRRDTYTFEHSKRVAAYAEGIARTMRLSSEEVDTIRLAARVHDLGKIGVPDSVLRKPGKLSAEEWSLMMQHPEIGYEILSRFSEYRRGMELVRAHHERFDGAGYPHGKRGDRIDQGAQIIAVADTLDAITSDRPYRRALPLEVALAELGAGKDTQWDGSVVAAAERFLASPRAHTAPGGQSGSSVRTAAMAMAAASPAPVA